MAPIMTLVAVAELSATTGSRVAMPPIASPITTCVPVSKRKIPPSLGHDLVFDLIYSGLDAAFLVYQQISCINS
jgi:hypothetical protein